MSKHTFLSEEWIVAFTTLHAEYRDSMPSPAVRMKMNQVVTEVPFGSGEVLMHIDTSDGQARVGSGHVDGPDLTVKTDYVTARMLFIENDPQKSLQAFMQGKIKPIGDMTKLMVPPPPANEAQKEFESKVRDLTE